MANIFTNILKPSTTTPNQSVAPSTNIFSNILKSATDKIKSIAVPTISTPQKKAVLPSIKPTVTPTGNIFSNILKPKTTEPVFQARVGEGLTPEQKARAEFAVKNQPEPIGQTIKAPFLNAGVTVPKEGGIGGLYSYLKGAIELPEKAARSVTEAVGVTKPNSAQRKSIYATPSYGEQARTTTGELIDQGVDPSGAVILGSAIPAGAFAGTLLDFSGFGGKAVTAFEKGVPNKFFKFVAKEENPVVLEATLKKIGLDDINAKNLSVKLAPTKTVQEAKDVLAGFGKPVSKENPFANILKPVEEAPGIVPRQALIPEAPKGPQIVPTQAITPEIASVPTTAPAVIPEAIPAPQAPTVAPVQPIKNSSETQFTSPAIRPLTETEQPVLQKINSVIQGNSKTEIIAHTPEFVSYDGKERPLILDKATADKVAKIHGNMVPENLVLNANEWDYVIKNVDGNVDKINLVKAIPNSNNFLTIGANRNNGFFIVTHYEALGKDSEKLKNLLKNKGDTLDRSGRAVVPSFATSPEGAASQLDLSGVKSDTSIVPEVKKKVNIPETKSPQELSSRPIKQNRFPVSSQVARQAIIDGIGKYGYTKEDLKVLFTDELINGRSLGTFEKENKWMGNLVKLYEDKGKVGLVTALHESKHFLFSKMPEALQKELLEQAAKDIGPMEKGLLKVYYPKVGMYAGADRNNRILEEYIVDKWARSDSKDYGFKESIWNRAFTALDKIFKKIVDVYKKVRDAIRNTPNKQGGFVSMGGDKNKLDKLIAEGQIRIVSRDGKNVYQVRGKGNWITAQSKESAVMMATPKNERPLPKDLQDKENYVEILKETLDQNPAKDLVKYIDPKLGGLPEVGKSKAQIGTNRPVSKWKAEGDSIATEAGFPDSDTAREAVDDFVQKKQELKALEKELKMEKSEIQKSPNQLPYVAKGKVPLQEKQKVSQPASKDQQQTGTDLRSPKENISYAKSITQIVEDASDSKYAFENFRGDPFTDSVNVPIKQSIFDDITERAKEENFMFKAQGGFSLNARDPFRSFEAFFGKKLFPEIKETFLDPFDLSKGEYIDTRDELADALKAKTQELGIKINSKEDRAIMDYGERNLPDDLKPANIETRDTLVAKFGAQKADKIIQADKFFREQYNTLIDRINAERKKIYGDVWEKKKDMDSEIELLEKNIKEKSTQLEDKVDTDTLAYNKLQNQIARLKRSLENRKELLKSDLWWRGKVIGKRNDYYRHYFELAEGFKALKNILTTDANISTKLAGISTQTKPKSKFLQFAQARTGNKSERSAIGGFLNYIPSASYAIHIDPHIEGFRKLADSLRASDNKAYSPMIEFITDFANDLAGKTNEIDRGIQKVTGRKVFKVIDWINGRVKANTILGNISSSMAQIFNVPQGVASAKQHSIKGAARSFAQIVQKNPAMEQSSFIKERFAKSITNQFDTAWIHKPKQFAVWMLGALDEVGTKFIWNSHYEKALAEKIPNPIKYADDTTRKLVGGRGIGEVPLVQKSKIFQMIAPFQLEVGNSWWVMKDFVSKKDFSALVLFFVTAYVMNEQAKKIRGSDVVFDPIQAIIEGSRAFNQEENKFKGAERFAGRVTGEILSNVPLGQSIAGLYPEYGYGKGDWNLTREELFGKGDPTRFGGGLLAMKGLQDPLFKVLLPFGGGQVKKTIEGEKEIREGGVFDKSGKLLYKQDQSIPGKAKTLAFGPKSSSAAKEYFDEEDTAAAEQAPIKKVYDMVQKLKEEGKEEQAKSLVDDLTDDEYETYKKVKASETRAKTLQTEKEIYPTFLKIQQLKKDGDIENAKKLLNGLTDDEYKAYELLKKQEEKGEKPEIPNGTEVESKSLISEVITYGKAIGVDPVTAFNRIFTGQRIRRVDNKTIIVERMSLPASQKVKTERSATAGMKLDHTLPLELGGSNSEDNLKLVTNAEWSSYTPIENYIAKQLKAKKITKKEAKKMILDFKNGIITKEQIYAK